MKMKRKGFTLAFACLISIARVAVAQEGCSDTDKLVDCWTRLYLGPQVTDAAAVAADELQKKTTGIDSFASDLSSTIKNFLPFFGGLIESQTVSDNGNTLTINLNLPFPQLGKGRTFQAQGIFRKPVLFEDVRKAFPEPVRATRAEELEKKLNDLDDASLVFSYNVVTARTGRSFEQHRNLHSAIFQAMINQIPPPQSERFLQQLGLLIQELPEITSGSQQFSSIQDEGKKALAKSLIEHSARAASEHREAVEKLANDKGLDIFADLVNNQPQFYTSVGYRSRQDLVGPDQLTAKLTYEKGFFNINALRGKLGKNCLAAAASGAAAPACLAPYSDWVNDNRERIKADERISISIQYTKDDSYSFQQAADHIDLRLPTSHELVASFSYGRYLMFTKDGQNTRLDISAMYEDVSNDASRRDRGVGSITLTRKINNSMSLPIGLVYANHGKFLGEVDKELSAHFGLKFNLGQAN